MSEYMEDERQGQDEDLDAVRRCKKGDDAAFEALVLRHQKMMMNIAYRMTGNYDDACEVVQEAFLSAYRGLRDFRGTSKFSTWLASITINLSKNRLKQVSTRAGREPVSLDDPVATSDGEVRYDPPSSEPSALDQLESRELNRQIQDCLAALDHEFREVIVLRDVQGYAYDEIAVMVGIAAGTVKSRLFRARETVKNCLKKALGDRL